MMSISLSNEERLGLLREIGLRIKQERAVRQITQSDLAKALNTKQSVVSRIEAGGTGTSVVTLYRIAKALNVSLGALIPKEF